MDYNSATVAVVILNWNGRVWLSKFLPTVLENSPAAEVIVADNASTDDSVDFMQQHFPEVRLLELDQNYGFAEGYNQALHHVEATYYVLLNSDVEVTPNWLSPMVRLLENNSTIAACQPKIKSYHRRSHFEYAGAAGGFLDKHGYPFCRGRLFDTLEVDLGQYDDEIPVFWATGACMMVRSSAFWQAEGLDKDFFAHMEEIDLCWRLQNLGHQIYYTGKSTIYHVGGGTLPKANPKKTFLNFRNGLLLLYKNLAVKEQRKIILARLMLDGVAATQFLAKGDRQQVKAIWEAHQAFFKTKAQFQSRRQSIVPKKATKELTGWYGKSVVWQYFVKGKNEFRQLDVPDRAPFPA